ncbi:ECF RNA polymerase sigma factor SigK [Lapillicoccus jejuensis]|uniref:RNA polymerase sigma-70 factor (ECF subfamily) n=1 Tax=Lapillicoccus jejuensis TaxID=402171 RepID=A0A542E046_9MICO|nr:RNA polymerase sigma-70 factor (ECF subfamily) [Lapillicoccus jejuensis]
MDSMAELHAVPSDPSEGTAPGPDTQADDFAAWLDRSGLGDEGAFAELYDALSRRLYGLVLRVVRDPAQSEEVTQEAFLEIWRTASRFDRTRGSALGWMMTIAHRKAVDRVRSAEAASRRDTQYHESSQDVDFDSTAEAAHTSLDVERVRKALASLTDAQRSALELAYFGGYTHSEVATMLGLPLGTAKTRIRDGLIRLRDTLGITS